MTPRRAAHRRQAGNTAILVAVSAVGLIAVTGLALDGGMEAGAFRHAQNAADAGSLAAARQIFVNSMSGTASTVATLSPVANTEVQHNGATMLSLTAGSPGSVSLNSKKVWIPATSGGMAGQAALADLWGTSGTALLQYNTELNLLGTQSTAQAAAISSGGSVASSQVDTGSVQIPSVASGTFGCYSASAHYVAGHDTIGQSSVCPVGSALTGVSASGTLLGGADTGVEVSSANVPTARPRISASTILGSLGVSGALNVSASVSATQAHSSNTLAWDNLTGEPVATASVEAEGVHVYTPALTIDASVLRMSVSLSIDPTTNQGTVTRSCTPTTVSFKNLINNSTATATIDKDCNQTGLSALSGNTQVTSPWSQPAFTPSAVCSTSNGGNTITCSVQTCFVRSVTNALPYNTTVCLAEANPSLSVSAVDCSSTTYFPVAQFCGTVTVGATVPQATYFLRIFGWTQTSPATQATAGVQPIADVSDAAFAASPFAMPDAGTNMVSPYQYERLVPGHTYYLYGPSMQTYNPSSMPSGWQGQLDSASPHKVDGDQLVAAASTTMTPHVYTGSSSYYLVPVFDPTTLVVEYYGVFLPVTGQPNWGLLVNSIPTLGGRLVQAVSQTTWTQLMEGAASVKLEQ
jgi:hypothetical protein